MAGGKETPRQKMIGMMYLVLTAILALNVASSILDAFVAIEENIQNANLTELFRGDERKDQLIEASVDVTNPEKAKNAKLLQKVIEDIDKETAERIKLIDDLKLEILNACGEDVSTVNKESAILMEKYDPKVNALKPIRMNLDKVQGKDKYDEVMNIVIGDEITTPSGKGMDIWKSLNDYRAYITETIASSQLGSESAGGFNKEYFYKAPSINDFESQADLDKMIKESIDKSKVHPEDAGMISEIYKSLTKQEFSTVHDVKNVHWIGKTFDHAPTVAAIASLSSLQNDILKARANALTLIRGRVSGNDYSFNRIISLAYGPEVVNQNEEFTVNVMMVAYDSDKQPIVTYNGANVDSVQNGQGSIKLRAQGDLMELKGTVTIRDKAGIEKTLPWEKTVHVMKPSGSIELPELNVLYRGYRNQVNATASGFERTELNASGANVTRDGSGYIVTPNGTSRTATLSVVGRSSNGRSVVLKTLQFRVLNLPDPSLYWGASKSGGRVPAGDYRIFPKFGPEIPLNAQFKAISWTVSAAGTREVSGTGNDLSAAQGLIRAVPAGKDITVSVWVLDPNQTRRRISGVFTK